MRAIFPGTFNPFHEGHAHVLREALKVFSEIVVMIGRNPSKGEPPTSDQVFSQIETFIGYQPARLVKVFSYDGLLVDSIPRGRDIKAIVRGLRNDTDFNYEQKMLNINKELGLQLPVFYVMSDKNLVDVSSSKIRGKK